MEDNSKNLLSHFLEKIFSEKLSILCGAGISYNSGLPVVYQFLTALFEKFELAEEQRQLIYYSDYPFEAIMELLQKETDITDLLRIFGLGDYNTNHLFMAYLAKERRIKNIVTTNFDTLIEQAFAVVGLYENIDYNIYSTEEEFANIVWSGNGINLIKIHGTASDLESMAINMEMVATQTMCVNKNRVIKQLFNKSLNPTVIILGYSSSDVFDISPEIKLIKNNQSAVLYLEHSKDKEFHIEDITLKVEKNPFTGFADSHRLFYDTDDFVKALWSLANLPDYKFISRERVIWNPLVDRWFAQAEKALTNGFKHQICGRLFHNICEFDSSIDHYDKSIAIALQLNDEQRFSSELGNLALTYNSVGRFKDAVNCLNASLASCERIGNSQGQISQLQSLGNVYKNMGQYDMSEQCFLSASRIIESQGDEYDLCTTLGNLITLYNKTGDYAKTVFYGEKAHELAGKLGIKQSEGSILCSLGSAYYSLGQTKKAIDHMERGIAIGRLIGNNNIICLGQTNLALIYTHERQYNLAIDVLMTALPLSLSMGTQHNSGLIYLSLGQNHVALNQVSLAMENFERAKLIWGNVFDPDHPNLTILYKEMRSIKGL